MTKKDAQWLLDEKYGGNETEDYKADVMRLATGEPLGYVIGHQPFLGLTIYLDSHPLIPRTETEWWTDELLTQLEKGEAAGGETEAGLGRAARSAPIFWSADERSLNFLDLCAGSGAIGCAALARLRQARVYFGEINPTHEATILKNIHENNLDSTRAHVGIGDLFEPFDDLQFDIIAINPPYIPIGRELPSSVADHEPGLALFSGEDGLDLIRRIAKELPHHLAEGGTAQIECDSTQTEAASALFINQGFEVSIGTDQYGVPRTIICETAKNRSVPS